MRIQPTTGLFGHSGAGHRLPDGSTCRRLSLDDGMIDVILRLPSRHASTSRIELADAAPFLSIIETYMHTIILILLRQDTD